MELLRSHIPSFPLLLISLAFLYNCSSFAEVNDLITDVCSHSKNPPFCIKALRSDPRSAGANLTGLGQISIDLSTTSAKTTHTLVNSLKQKATDKRLIGIYDSCLENYGDSIDDLGDCTKLLKSGDYQGLNSKASAALDGPVTCDNNFQDAKISEPGQLVDASQNVQGLCGIILAVSNRLQGNV